MFFFFFKQKTAYEMRISDWSSDVCSSDLLGCHEVVGQANHRGGQSGNHCNGAHNMRHTFPPGLFLGFDHETRILYSGRKHRRCGMTEQTAGSRFRLGVSAAEDWRMAVDGCLLQLIDRKSTRLNSSH